MRLIIIILSFCFSMNLFAADGSSGCGPGWYVTSKTSLLSSAIRGTTNAILVPTVTLGMTFGTSKCSKHSIVKKEMENLKYATENYFEIAADIAKGDGVYLNAYSDLMGCKDKAQIKFKSSVQNKFNSLFKNLDVNPEHLVEETYKIILRDKELTQSCFSA